MSSVERGKILQGEKKEKSVSYFIKLASYYVVKMFGANPWIKLRYSGDLNLV